MKTDAVSVIVVQAAVANRLSEQTSLTNPSNEWNHHHSKQPNIFLVAIDFQTNRKPTSKPIQSSTPPSPPINDQYI